MAVTTTAPGRRPLANWAGLGGVLYVALFIIGSILSFSGTPDGDATPAEVRTYYADSGHRDKIGIGWILIGLGLVAFLWFLASLRQWLRGVDGDGFLTGLATIGGSIYAALALAAIAVYMGISTMSDDTFNDVVYPGLIHAAGDAGYVLHATGGAGAAVMIFAASLAALRARAIPVWLGWLGFLAALAALASIAFLPQILLALWILVAGIMLFLAPATPQGAQSAPR
jgi:hypothetical protein